MSLPIRIIKELKRINDDPIPNITVVPNEDNIREIYITMIGPSDTPYENGKFRLEMFLQDSYPIEPPKIRFLTKIYHPNIDKIGRICMDILKKNWTPALQIRTILLSLQSLLSEPNLADPLDPKVGEHWSNNTNEAKQMAKEMTKKYAI
jgi:ubiquitin-conjugating enzyme E2 N